MTTLARAMAFLASPLVMAVAMLSSAVLTMPSAHADSPRAGQPCDIPSRIVILGRNSEGPMLICAVATGQPGSSPYWSTYDVSNFSTTDTMTIGDPCRVSSGFFAPALDYTPGREGLYLATCSRGKWAPYRP